MIVARVKTHFGQYNAGDVIGLSPAEYARCRANVELLEPAPEVGSAPAPYLEAPEDVAGPEHNREAAPTRTRRRG
jgi:hypothetical protein